MFVFLIITPVQKYGFTGHLDQTQCYSSSSVILLFLNCTLVFINYNKLYNLVQYLNIFWTLEISLHYSATTSYLFWGQS